MQETPSRRATTDSFAFRILGPLEVRAGANAIRIGGPKQRALLALLLLSANRVVSRDLLIHELGDQDPRAADHALRVQVSRLRKALGADGSDRLQARPPGYVLRVEPGELDLDLFEERAGEGREALADGDVERAGRLLREAEALWRGRPLADLEFEPFARVEVGRLEELRLGVIEDRIDAELQLGRHSQLVSELDTLVLAHPFRERLRAQQMLALYRAGRQADALEAYRTARVSLVDELAVEPSRALRELEQAILRHDDSLELAGGVRTTTVSERAPPPTPVAPPERAERRRLTRRTAVVAITVAAALTTAVAVAALDGGSSEAIAPAVGNALTAVSPVTGKLLATVSLSSAPSAGATGFGSLWVTEVDANRVVRIDRHRRAVVETIPVGREPTAVATGAGAVWVANALDGTVSRIDPATDTVVQTIPVGPTPAAVAVAAGSVWVASHGDGTVVRIDPASGRRDGAIATGDGPSALAADGSTLWVANDASGTVARVDTRTRSVVSVIHVGDAPSALVMTRAGLWVLDRLDATVSRVDPVRNVVAETLPLNGAPSDLAGAAQAVWVADAAAGTLSQIDPRRGGVTRVIRIGELSPALVGAFPDAVWAAAAAGGAQHRGGTLRIAFTNSVIDALDPASSNAPNVAPLLGLTNDGLVTFDHVPGADGTRLVPDLAVSLPRPTDHGRSYAFRLRPGIRYSNGAALKPADVLHSFERIFEQGSSGAAYFADITGAHACSRRHCDLQRGIVVGESDGTVTFHLAEADPDFLYKLTLPYADVLPASLSSVGSEQGVPATGPYQVGRYTPRRILVLVRNPRFREWSAAAQPAGYPARIEVQLDLDNARGAAAVASGRSDLMPSLAVIPRADRSYFFVRHPDRVHVNPALGTNFLFLNVNAPPFNDIRVRRALNYALDRARIVAADGGPATAAPTCQLLPPQLPGYKRYCPYTRTHNTSGDWSAPDLERARNLVAASGTRGMRVSVWDTYAPAVFVNEGQATVAALRSLGYRASLRLLPDSRYFTFTNDSRNLPQVVDGGWSAEYPSADTIIGKLTCRYFTPDDGPATTDAGELCDPTIDRQVARAAALQTTDPPAAARVWHALDRTLTDRAVWLPTITPNEVDLLSARIGNYEYNPVRGVLIDQLWVR